MPDILVIDLVPNKTGVLDELETQIQEAAAADPALGLAAKAFHVTFLAGQPTMSTGKRVLVKIDNLYDRPSPTSSKRTKRMRDELCDRVAAVLTIFTRSFAPHTKQVHVTCQKFRIQSDSMTIIML